MRSRCNYKGTAERVRKWPSLINKKTSISFTIFLVIFLTPFLSVVDAQTGPPEEQQRRREEAQKEDDPDRITVIADYEPLDPEHMPAQVTVITEDEIAAAAPRNVAEIIAPMVGVQINRYGSTLQPSMVTIRGSSPEQVLVLVNGKRMNSAQGGGVDLSTIRPDDIKRIEIIRGGGSALFGESAFGGVINIITKSGFGKDLQASLEYEFGSFNTHTASGHIGGSFGRENAFDFFLSAGGTFSKGAYTYADEHAQGGTAERVNAGGLVGEGSAKLGWDINDDADLRLSLSGQAYESERGVPGLLEFPTETATMRDRRYMGLLSFNYLRNPIAGITLDVYARWQWRRYQDPEFYFGNIDDKHDNKALGADLTLNRMDDFSVVALKTTAGYAFRYDHLLSTALMKASGSEAEGTVSRQNHSGYFRNELHLFPYEEGKTGRVVLFPAVRYAVHRVVSTDTNVKKNEQAFSWNVGCMVPFSKEREVTVKGTIGTSYRLPSFDDLFWPTTAFAVGNPNLLPERAFNYDIGLTFKPYDFFSMEIAHFSSDITNLIQWNPGANGQWQPQNVGKALLNGLEVRVKFLFEVPMIASFLELEGNYTYLFARDMVEGSPTYGKQLPRRPFEQANVIGTVSHTGGHSVRLEGRFIGYRYITAQNTKYLPSAFLLNATVRATLWKHVTLIGSLKNIFDVSYVDVREYPVPGREFTLSVSVHF